MSKRIRYVITHYFIPHETNNYKAKSLHVSSLIFYCLLLIFMQSFLGIVRRTNPNVLGYATDITVEKILYLINQERERNSLLPLNLSPELSTAATEKASDMLSKNYWAHISPTGTSPWEFITKTGYSYVYAGENLAKSFYTSEEVVSAWTASPTHRANILKPEYTDIGLSVMNGILNGEETTLVVQEFGTRVKKLMTEVNVTPVPNNIEEVFEKSEQTQDLIAGTQTEGSIHKKDWFNFLFLPKTISLIVTEFMLAVLFIDSLYMWKYKTARISSRTIAHIIFIGSLLTAMSATGIGVIL